MQCRQSHDRDENGPEPDHDVVTVVDHFETIGPQVLWEIVQAFDVRLPLLISKKAEHARNFQWIVEFAVFDIGLAQNRQRRAVTRFE